jgi:peroxiredoxin
VGDGDPLPIIISTGDEEENRRLLGKHGIAHPVVVQREDEVASLYWVSTTPAGYVVDENGITASILYTGAEALLAAAQGRGVGSTPPTPAERRGFSRSVQESKITRDGLKAGAAAPDFTLPLIEGGELSLGTYRGQKVLLVFSDPHCEPCNALAPGLEKLHQSSQDLRVLMIGRGDLDANRRKAAEHGLTFPVAVQSHWEISRSYGIFATPVGYWIDEAGSLAADVAVGAEAILKLAATAGTRVKLQPVMSAR